MGLGGLFLHGHTFKKKFLVSNFLCNFVHSIYSQICERVGENVYINFSKAVTHSNHSTLKIWVFFTAAPNRDLQLYGPVALL